MEPGSKVNGFDEWVAGGPQCCGAFTASAGVAGRLAHWTAKRPAAIVSVNSTTEGTGSIWRNFRKTMCNRRMFDLWLSMLASSNAPDSRPIRMDKVQSPRIDAQYPRPQPRGSRHFRRAPL